MILNGVSIPEAEVEGFCQRHAVQRFSLFGSILRDDFSARSDIDVLVEFQPGKGPSLLGFAGMQIELSQMLGRSVHLHTPAMLPPRARDRILTQARQQYAA